MHPPPRAETRTGFTTLLVAQFLSSLADNAVLIIAIALLDVRQSPAWMTPFLKFGFIASFVVFGFAVGALADRWPKPKVMMATNALKAFGCALLMWGVHPLAAYALIGFGAAAYSPAKYGLLLELVPPRRLVVANAWIEGLTIGSVVVGVFVGGSLVSPEFARFFGQPEARTPHALTFAIGAVLGLYVAAALVNLALPDGGRCYVRTSARPAALLRNFRGAVYALAADPSGRVSLATTTLLWGVGAVLQFLMIDWGRQRLDLELDRASMLPGLVTVGVACGALFAARCIALERALVVLPLGLLLGPLVMALLPVHSVVVAAVLMGLLGVAAGFFIVPMNALLQHRGHALGNAGQSIAVQNFCENLSVMVALSLYAFARQADWSLGATVVVFGSLTSVAMGAIAFGARRAIVIAARTPSASVRVASTSRLAGTDETAG